MELFLKSVKPLFFTFTLMAMAIGVFLTVSPLEPGFVKSEGSLLAIPAPLRLGSLSTPLEEEKKISALIAYMDTEGTRQEILSAFQQQSQVPARVLKALSLRFESPRGEPYVIQCRIKTPDKEEMALFLHQKQDLQLVKIGLAYAQAQYHQLFPPSSHAISFSAQQPAFLSHLGVLLPSQQTLLPEESRTALEAKLIEYQAHLKQVQKKSQVLLSQLGFKNLQEASQMGQLMENPELTRLYEYLIKLDKNLTRLKADLGETHPKWIQTQELYQTVHKTFADQLLAKAKQRPQMLAKIAEMGILPVRDLGRGTVPQEIPAVEGGSFQIQVNPVFHGKTLESFGWRPSQFTMLDNLLDLQGEQKGLQQKVNGLQRLLVNSKRPSKEEDTVSEQGESHQATETTSFTEAQLGLEDQFLIKSLPHRI